MTNLHCRRHRQQTRVKRKEFVGCPFCSSKKGVIGVAQSQLDYPVATETFLRAELKITDAQAAAWSAFADILRANAKSLGEVRAVQRNTQSPSLIDRLMQQEKCALGA